MFTATELANQLAACERQIVAIRLKAEEKKAQEEERYAHVCQKREECVASHRKKVDDLVAEYTQQLEGAVAMADSEIAQLDARRAQVLQQSSDAQARTADLKLQAKALEREVRTLCMRIDGQEADYERQGQELQQEVDEHVHGVLQNCHTQIYDVSTFASEMRDRTLESIASMQVEARALVDGSAEQSKSRSRFEDLVTRISRRHSQDLSAEQLLQAKTELLQAWLDDWARHASRQTSEAPSYLTEVLSAEVLSASISPRRHGSRSVERQMEVATMRKQSLASGDSGLVSGWGEYRPQTAP